MTTACIIQARSGSTRLPRKIFLPLGDRSMLANVVARCYEINEVDTVVVAVPDGDIEAAKEAERAGAFVAYGPELDVLRRYRMAAEAVNADTIIRITSDCPLIDPLVARAVLMEHKARNCHFTSNDHRQPAEGSWPKGMGVEVFSAYWLWKADATATGPNEREHVSPWMAAHVTDQRQYFLACPKNFGRRWWTVDTREDYDHVKRIYDWLGTGRAKFSWLHTAEIEDRHAPPFKPYDGSSC